LIQAVEQSKEIKNFHFTRSFLVQLIGSKDIEHVSTECLL